MYKYLSNFGSVDIGSHKFLPGSPILDLIKFGLNIIFTTLGLRTLHILCLHGIVIGSVRISRQMGQPTSDSSRGFSIFDDALFVVIFDFDEKRHFVL